MQALLSLFFSDYYIKNKKQKQKTKATKSMHGLWSQAVSARILIVQITSYTLGMLPWVKWLHRVVEQIKFIMGL